MLLVTTASSAPQELSTAPPLAPPYTFAVVRTIAAHGRPDAPSTASTCTWGQCCWHGSNRPRGRYPRVR